MQEVIRGLTGTARHRAYLGSHDRCRAGQHHLPLRDARELMGYSGAFPSENSSGKRIRRGGITKSGNAHLRRIVVESAWSYRHRPAIGAKLRRRQEGLPAEITEIAWKAQNRLHKRYMKLMASRQGSEKDHDRDRTRTAGLHLGHRDQGRSDRQQATNGGMTNKRTKAKTFQIRKKQKQSTYEQRYPTRGQGQPQPEQARRRILGVTLRQAQPDSR